MCPNPGLEPVLRAGEELCRPHYSASVTVAAAAIATGTKAQRSSQHRAACARPPRSSPRPPARLPTSRFLNNTMSNGHEGPVAGDCRMTSQARV